MRPHHVTPFNFRLPNGDSRAKFRLLYEDGGDFWVPLNLEAFSICVREIYDYRHDLHELANCDNMFHMLNHLVGSLPLDVRDRVRGRLRMWHRRLKGLHIRI